MPLTIPEAMHGAASAYGRGEWVRAEELCRTILRTQSTHFDALFLLGIIAIHTPVG